MLYKELRDWLGVDELDMSTFDVDDMNFRLKELPRIYKQIYEDRVTPTQRSIDLIERRYANESKMQNVVAQAETIKKLK